MSASTGLVIQFRGSPSIDTQCQVAVSPRCAGKYKSKALLLVSYVVFSYGLTGPILPLWFMKDAYVASLQARGKDAAYIDGVFVNINTGTFFISMIAILVCAVLGGWFGQRMMKKHFIKAGIA